MFWIGQGFFFHRDMAFYRVIRHLDGGRVVMGNIHHTFTTTERHLMGMLDRGEITER